MDILNAIMDAGTVIIAHVVVGLLAAPLKYKKSISILIWSIWGVIQTMLLTPILFVDYITKTL